MGIGLVEGSLALDENGLGMPQVNHNTQGGSHFLEPTIQLELFPNKSSPEKTLSHLLWKKLIGRTLL